MDALIKATAFGLDRIYSAFDKAAKKAAEHGLCDICEERPGDRVVPVSGLCVCIECDEKEDAPNRRFHTNDDAAAYDAGVRARGEI